jgi:hypothetical protein
MEEDRRMVESRCMEASRLVGTACLTLRCRTRRAIDSRYSESDAAESFQRTKIRKKELLDTYTKSCSFVRPASYPATFTGLSGYGGTRKKCKREGTVESSGKDAKLVSEEMTSAMAGHLG